MAEVSVYNAVLDFFALVLRARDEFEGTIIFPFYGYNVSRFELDILNPFPR